ncbi:MAG: PEP-CTERM sorting domain-containing protein [Terrimicrobiaceae bacterium]
MNTRPYFQTGSFKLSQLCAASGILALLLAASSPAYSVIVADFADGNTSAAVDGYVGKAGSGWGGAWVSKTTNMTIDSAAVTNSTPLKTGADNYLAVSTSAAALATTPVMTINRQYGAAGGGVTLTGPTQFTFLFRPDTGSSIDYRYVIYDAAASQSGTSSNCSWIIAAQSGFWRVVNGNKAGGVTSEIITSAAVTLGTAYEFTVDTNPATQTWGVTIANTGGSVLYSNNSLGFRTISTSLGGYLAFGVSDTATASASTFGYSFDSIAIVPEPSSIALVSLSVLGLLVLRKRAA